MSTDAKNVKIITENGRVTLRGPVKSADEKSQIEKIASDVAGEGKVDSQLEVAVGR
jgi:hyperosmotically inducible protein